MLKNQLSVYLFQQISPVRGNNIMANKYSDPGEKWINILTKTPKDTMKTAAIILFLVVKRSCPQSDKNWIASNDNIRVIAEATPKNTKNIEKLSIIFFNTLFFLLSVSYLLSFSKKKSVIDNLTVGNVNGCNSKNIVLELTHHSVVPNAISPHVFKIMLQGFGKGPRGIRLNNFIHEFLNLFFCCFIQFEKLFFSSNRKFKIPFTHLKDHYLFEPFPMKRSCNRLFYVVLMIQGQRSNLFYLQGILLKLPSQVKIYFSCSWNKALLRLLPYHQKFVHQVCSSSFSIFNVYNKYNIFKKYKSIIASFLLLSVLTNSAYATDYTRQARDILRDSTADVESVQGASDDFLRSLKQNTQHEVKRHKQTSFFGLDLTVDAKKKKKVQKFIESLPHDSKAYCKKGTMKESDPRKFGLPESSESEPKVITPQFMIFVSFSLPDSVLKALFEQSIKYNGRLVVRGLIDNSFPTTQKRLKALGITVDIDPPVFEKHDVKRVPTFVVSPSKKSIEHDKVSGNISCTSALEMFAREGHFKDLSRGFMASSSSADGGNV